MSWIVYSCWIIPASVGFSLPIFFFFVIEKLCFQITQHFCTGTMLQTLNCVGMKKILPWWRCMKFYFRDSGWQAPASLTGLPLLNCDQSEEGFPYTFFFVVVSPLGMGVIVHETETAVAVLTDWNKELAHHLLLLLPWVFSPNMWLCGYFIVLATVRVLEAIDA